MRSTILVVEDDSDLRELIVECLEGDFVVKTACNGEDGMAAAHLHRPDLLLCDYNMPVRTGVWLISTLRQDAAFAHLPVILMSGKQDPEVSATLGVTFLAKPFGIDQLLETVSAAVSSHLSAAA